MRFVMLLTLMVGGCSHHEYAPWPSGAADAEADACTVDAGQSDALPPGWAPSTDS